MITHSMLHATRCDLYYIYYIDTTLSISCATPASLPRGACKWLADRNKRSSLAQTFLRHSQLRTAEEWRCDRPTDHRNITDKSLVSHRPNTMWATLRRWHLLLHFIFRHRIGWLDENHSRAQLVSQIVSIVPVRTRRWEYIKRGDGTFCYVCLHVHSRIITIITIMSKKRTSIECESERKRRK